MKKKGCWTGTFLFFQIVTCCIIQFISFYLNQEICDQDQGAINDTDSIGESEIDLDFESDLESQNELFENMDIQQDSTTINMDKINKSITIL